MKKTDKIFATIISACVVILFYVMSKVTSPADTMPPMRVIDTAVLNKMNEIIRVYEKSYDSMMLIHQSDEQKFDNANKSLNALKKKYIRQKYSYDEILSRYDSLSRNKDTIISIVQCDSIRHKYSEISDAFGLYINQSDSVMSNLYIAHKGLQNIVVVQDATIDSLKLHLQKVKKKKQRRWFWSGMAVGAAVTTVIALVGSQ